MVGVLSSRRSCRPQYRLGCPILSETGAAQSQGQTQTETGESSTAEKSPISVCRELGDMVSLRDMSMVCTGAERGKVTAHRRCLQGSPNPTCHQHCQQGDHDQ